ncbi:MAG: universal stress protein [Armatimonadota bacterium]
MKKILVAVDGTGFSDDVVKTASKLAKLEKAKLFIVYVFEVPQALPLDAEVPEESEKADKVLNHAAEIAEEFGLDVEIDMIHARTIGPGIVDEAKDLDIDMIMIGMSHKPRFGEIFFGSTVNYVLKNSTIPVLLLKETPGDTKHV